MEQEEGEFLYHEPCTACGSSDARAVYDSGTFHCFSCKDTGRTDGEPIGGNRGGQTYMKGETVAGEYNALGKRGISLDTCKKFQYQTGKYKGKPVQIANYFKDGHKTAQHIRYPDKDFGWLGGKAHCLSS